MQLIPPSSRRLRCLTVNEAVMKTETGQQCHEGAASAKGPHVQEKPTAEAADEEDGEGYTLWLSETNQDEQ